MKESGNEAVGVTAFVAFEKHLHIERKMPDNLNVEGDRDMLNSVLPKWLANTIKFTHEEGDVTLSASRVQFENTNSGMQDAVEFKVKETGVGISEENIEKLFRIDVNHSTLGTAKEKGSGLGLILCKEFVRVHGGDLSVESEKDKGSTFSFFIPTKN